MDDARHPLSDPETWLDAHGDALYRFALQRVREPALAEDLVQDTLLAALRARAGFAAQASERTWLIAILKNKIIDHYRRAGRESPLPEHLDPDEAVDALFRDEPDGHWAEPPSSWPRPDTALEQAEFWRVFQECLDALPARQSQAFVLSEIDGLTTAELCKLFGASTSNMWVLLHRARLRLRGCLESRWFAPHGE